MKVPLLIGFTILLASTVQAQIQVELKFKRLQYVAHEPVLATVKITNLAGHALELADGKGQRWFGFEVNADSGHLLAPLRQDVSEPALHLETGETVTRKFNLRGAFPVEDLGVYHVRANVYFADSDRFFYSTAKVFEITDARPIWQRAVGVPEGMPVAGENRTYALLSHRFPEHTSLYVRVEDKEHGIVYATYSLGRLMSYDEPQTQLDRANQLHVLHCTAPRTWSYSHIGLNGELLGHSSFMETRTRPRLRQQADGVVAIRGGKVDLPVVQSSRNQGGRLPVPVTTLPAED
ncbi:MAG TPA: hypothetical protein VIW67_18200 [Terriglobales bacterium]